MIQGLPLVLEEIADVAGTEAMWALVRARGGSTIFLPRRVTARHWLAEIVGLEAANRICAHFRSNHQSRVEVPLAQATQKAERWREELRQPGSLSQRALRMGVTERTVRNWRRRMRGDRDEDQGDLF